MARSYAALNQYDNAIKAYQEAAKLKPGDEEIHNNLANIYARVGNMQEAVEQFKLALNISPSNATIYRNLGAVYMGMKKYASAYHAFKQAVELEPSFKEELKDAIQKLEKVKDTLPDIEYSFSIG
jgi:tetratricopeptide (TPR) repeat protein